VVAEFGACVPDSLARLAAREMQIGDVSSILGDAEGLDKYTGRPTQRNPRRRKNVRNRIRVIRGQSRV